MLPDFSKPGQQYFERSDSLPAGYDGMILQGARVLTAHHEQTGTLVLQELQTNDFVFKFNVYHLLRPLTLSGYWPPALLSSFLALKNSFRYAFKGLTPATLKQGEFALLHQHHPEAILDFKQPGTYHSLEVCWQEKTVQEYMNLFTLLQPLGVEKNRRRNFFVTKHSTPAINGIFRLAKDLIGFGNNSVAERRLFEHKVEEYLLSMLIVAGQPAIPVKKYRSAEQEKIQELAARLRSHPEKKFPLEDLERETLMNEKKLSQLFEELYGQSPFEYHMAARMEIAHRLLEETTLTIPQVAKKVGYAYSANFTRKFMDFFGYPPSRLNQFRW